jgi:hypothetical protein
MSEKSAAMRVVRLRDVRRAAKKTCLTRAGLTGLTGAGLIGAGAHAQGRFVERAHAQGRSVGRVRRSVHPYGMQGRVRRSVGRAGAHAHGRFAEWAGLVRPAGLGRIVTLCMKFFGITQSLTARRTGSLIRPLMSISRDDVKKLCRFWGLPIYPDVTNQEITFSRNRIRRQVLPALRLALNPQVDNVLSQSAEILLAERLHGDLLASKLPRASQPLTWLGAYHPAQAGYGPTNYLATRRIDDKAKAPYHGLPFSFEACEAYGPHAAWLRLPEMGRGEMIRKTCHEKKKCGRLLLQRSGWLFLPQVGGLFVDSAPGLARTLS